MDFRFSEDEQMILDSVKEFSKEVLEPECARLDDEKIFPRENLRQLGEMGMLGLLFPEEYGGVDLGYPLYYAVIEEVSRGCFNTGLMMGVHTMTGLGILHCGTPEQKQKYLPGLIMGEMIGAFALSEPDSGTDAGSLRATARLQGDHYVLDGTKAWISGAGEAGVYHVMANTDLSKGSRGITSFLVEPDWDGFELGKLEDKCGGNGLPLRQLIFDNLKVPADARMGEEGKGLRNALSSLEGGRIGIAANCTGVARKALEEAVKYAHERRQFETLLKDFQGIEWMIADMSAKIDASRLLYQKAAWLKQEGLPSARAASTCKRFATDSAMEITLDAVQIHGAYGYMKEYPVERLMRYVKSAQIFEGSNQIQRTLIAKSLFREMGY